jgi:WhiB family redox-sensing transcriptional regulator
MSLTQPTRRIGTETSFTALESSALTSPVISELDWTENANCKGKMKLFFAPKAERPQARERREAKARSLCSACIVQSTCKEFARNNREYGFWGGENEEERHMAGFTVAAPIGIRARVARSA